MTRERERRRQQQQPRTARSNAPAAVPGRGPDIRYLASSNIARRDAFNEAVAIDAGESVFERGDGWMPEDEAALAAAPSVVAPASPAVDPSVPIVDAPSTPVRRPGPGQVRRLEASNIARRDAFNETVADARRLAGLSSGFEVGE